MKLDRTIGVSIFLLVAFALCRGSAYSLTTVAFTALSTGTVAFLRFAIGALALLGWAAFSVRGWRWIKRDWKPILVFALIGNSVPFGLMTLGQQTVPSGLASVMMALTPMFSAIIAHLSLPDEKLNARAILGVGVGFAGVFAIVYARGKINLDAGMLYGLGALTLAAICIAITIVSVRFFRPTNQLGTATLSLVVAAVTLVPFVDFSDFQKPVPLDVIYACIALGVVGTALGWLSLLALSKRASAAFSSTVNYLIPIVGMAIGAIFLNETLYWTDAVALALIIGGTTLVKAGPVAPATSKGPAEEADAAIKA
ncbi:DMT family transporter [Rhizobium esperanzae]|uniref:Drug/metabolite transporter (DMT)-like permease n=1 Tax=Rhizobium esperanzae TaxID=1967781 RepID=A0A7W6R3L8_9HYPH|nr:DMT family transporter [Rhizobium esperanzae]MBB4236236.1 drug/metabolite transporter (DMT)-like permease [Rhizobium esperanzae]